MCYICYRVDFDGMSGSIYSCSCFSAGKYEMGITDPRVRLDATTSVKKIADILTDTLRLILTWSWQRQNDGSLEKFRRRVREVDDFSELLDINVFCKRVTKDDTETGVAYQLTYDFPSRTGTFSEARLSDRKVTFLGDPFVNEQGEEYDPFKSDV